jgi:hypothetical protein
MEDTTPKIDVIVSAEAKHHEHRVRMWKVAIAIRKKLTTVPANDTMRIETNERCDL